MHYNGRRQDGLTSELPSTQRQRRNFVAQMLNMIEHSNCGPNTQYRTSAHAHKVTDVKAKLTIVTNQQHNPKRRGIFQRLPSKRGTYCKSTMILKSASGDGMKIAADCTMAIIPPIMATSPHSGSCTTIGVGSTDE